MTRIKLITFAVLAACMLAGIATANASASKGEFVNQEGKPLKKGVFTATSGETRVETVAGTKVDCKNALALGVQTSATGGEATAHFTGCTSSSVLLV